LFAELLLSAEGVLATFLCLYLGIITPFLIAGQSTYRLTLTMAVASGIAFWSFIDLMDDAALLGVNQGFSGGLSHILLAGLFAAALLGLFWLDRRFGAPGKARRPVALTYGTALLVAAGIGFHSLGEGIEIGSLIGYYYALNPSSFNLVTAIGGLGSGAAYLLHKYLEGFIVGVFAATLTTRPSRGFILGLLAGVPTAMGLALAFVTPVDSTVFFGIGAAAMIYIECKLVPTLFTRGRTMVFVVALLLGFFLMYLAGLFHSYTTIF